MVNHTSPFITAFLTFFIMVSCNNEAGPRAQNERLLQEEKMVETPLNEGKDILTESQYVKLPFTGNVGHEYKAKLLPKIDSILYLPLNTSFDRSFNKRSDKYIHSLKSYKLQLPSTKGLEVYYTQLDCYKSQDANLISICGNFVDLNCGFLVFYHPEAKIAQVLNVKNSYYVDSGIEMNFSIDKDYKIQLTETGMTDGDAAANGDMTSESYSLSMHEIEVGKRGEILIEEMELNTSNE